MGQQQPQSKYRPGVEPVPGYHLRRWLGKGGFGEVWEASGPGGPKAALKFINLSGKEGRKEFRAVCMVKNVRHANLVPITAMWLLDSNGDILPDSWGEATSPPSNQTGNLELVIAMGLGEKNLLDRLKECMKGGHAGIPFDELVGYMAGSARAIDFLNSPTHDQGGKPVAIHHCDIKPQNIMIVGGAVQVCDFGLAQITTADNSNLMKSMIGGGFSPAYAAPESLLGKGPNRQTDLYSLAISYVELRTGALPFLPRSDFGMVRKAHIEGKLDLSRLEKNPEEVKVVRKATSPRPEDRYQTASEFVQALRAAGKAGQAPAAPPTAPAAPAAPPDVKLHAGMMVGQAYQLTQETWNLGWLSCWTAQNSKKQEEQLLIRDLHVGPPETTDWDAVEACESALANADERIFASHQKTWGLFPTGQPILYDVYDGARRGRLRWLIFAFRREQNGQRPLVEQLRAMSDAERSQIRNIDLVHALRPLAQRIDLLNQKNYELGGRNGPRLRRGKIQLLNISPWSLWAAGQTAEGLKLHLGDFCAARFMEVDHGALPAEEFLPRNPCLPPEALRRRLTPSADVYALAKTYVLLRQAVGPGGKASTLFAGPGADWEEVRRKIEERTVPPGASNEAKVLGRALTDLVKDRYATVDEFLTALEGALQKDSLHEETVNKHPSSTGGGHRPISSWNPGAVAIDVDLTRSLMPPEDVALPTPQPQFATPVGKLAWQSAPTPPASPVPPEALAPSDPQPHVGPQPPAAAGYAPPPYAVPQPQYAPPQQPYAPPSPVPQQPQQQPQHFAQQPHSAPQPQYAPPSPQASVERPALDPQQPSAQQAASQQPGLQQPGDGPQVGAPYALAEAPTQRSSSIAAADRPPAGGIFQTQPPKPRAEPQREPPRPVEPGWIGGLTPGAVVFEDCLVQKRLAWGLQNESRLDVFEASDGTGRSRVVLSIRRLPDDLVGSLDLSAVRQLKDRVGLHPNLSNIRVYWFLSPDLQPIPGATSLEILESGRPRYFAMGGRAADRTLSERCEAMWRSGHGMNWKEIVALLRPVAAALDALAQPIFEAGGRAASIQHLDVQPANILLDGPDAPRLNGLNFARLVSGASAALPAGWGEPTFFSAPELRRLVATIRSDQFSLAALYLTLRLGLNWQKAEVQQSSPADWLDKLPPAERAALEPACRATPSERYPSCTALFDAILPALAQPNVEGCVPSPPLRTARPAAAPAVPPQAPPAPAFNPAPPPAAAPQTTPQAAAHPAPPQPSAGPSFTPTGQPAYTPPAGYPLGGPSGYPQSGFPATGPGAGMGTGAGMGPAANLGPGAGLGGIPANSPIGDSMRLTPAGGSGLRPSASSWHAGTPTGHPQNPANPPAYPSQPPNTAGGPLGPGYPQGPAYPGGQGYPGGPSYPAGQGYAGGQPSYPGGPAYPGGPGYPPPQSYPGGPSPLAGSGPMGGPTGYPGGQGYSQGGYGYGNPYLSGYAPAPPPLDPTTSWMPGPGGYPGRPGFAPPGASGVYSAPPNFSGAFPAPGGPPGYPPQPGQGPPAGYAQSGYGPPGYPAPGYPAPGQPQNMQPQNMPQQGMPQQNMQAPPAPQAGLQQSSLHPPGYVSANAGATEAQGPWQGYGFNAPAGQGGNPAGPQGGGYGLQAPQAGGPMVSPPPAPGFAPTPTFQPPTFQPPAFQPPAFQPPAPQPAQTAASAAEPKEPAPGPREAPRPAQPEAAAASSAPPAAEAEPIAAGAAGPVGGGSYSVSQPPPPSPRAAEAGPDAPGLNPPGGVPLPPVGGYGFGPQSGSNFPTYGPGVGGVPDRVAPFPAPPTPTAGLRVSGDWQGMMSGPLPTPAGGAPGMNPFGMPAPMGGPLSATGEFDWDPSNAPPPPAPPPKPYPKHMRETPRGEAQKDTSLNDPRSGS